jgi:hypothetical protein
LPVAAKTFLPPVVTTHFPSWWLDNPNGNGASPRADWTQPSAGGTLQRMKPRNKKPQDLFERFQSTCGWCGKRIPENTPVYGGGGKARPGVDLSAHAGHVLAIRLVGAAKTVLVAVTGADSEARREGNDFVYMACSMECATAMKQALQDDIDLGKQLGLP